MNTSSYLKLSRHNVYIFRRRIPKSLADFFVTNELRVSTKTSDKKIALHIARNIANESDLLFARLKKNKNMADKKDFTELNNKLDHWKEKNYLRTQIDELDDLRLQDMIESNRKIKELKEGHERVLNEREVSHNRTIETVYASASKKINNPATLANDDLKLSVLVDEFFSAESLEIRKNAVATVRKNRDSLKLFIEIIGDKHISQIGQPDAVVFGRACPHYGRKEGAKRAVSTINGYMNSVSKFSSWVSSIHSETGHIKLDFSDLRYKNTNRPADERPAFTREEVIRILNHPQLLSFKITEPVKYWLPYIAAYTGARLEEITQLSPMTDIYEADGIWVIDINDRDGKSVKTRSSIRRVPIHSELITIGLLEYVKNLKTINAKTLFPDENVRDGRTGKNASKRVNRFIQKVVGIEKKSIHCFRHTFATILKRSELIESIAAEVMGQKHGGITYDRYGKGYLSETLKKAVERISFTD